MPKNAKYICKYCAAKTCSPQLICTNCKDKTEIFSRIQAMLKS